MHILRTPILLLSVVALLGLAVPSGAHGDETTNVILRAHTEDGAYWFTCSGVPCGTAERNPDLVLEAGHAYSITVFNDAEVGHDLNIGGVVDAHTTFLAPGADDTVAFTVPTDAKGETTYWCNPHKGLGMQGTVVFVGGADDNGSPGVGVVALLGALAGAMLVARRR